MFNMRRRLTRLGELAAANGAAAQAQQLTPDEMAQVAQDLFVSAVLRIAPDSNRVTVRTVNLGPELVTQARLLADWCNGVFAQPPYSLGFFMPVRGVALRNCAAALRAGAAEWFAWPPAHPTGELGYIRDARQGWQSYYTPAAWAIRRYVEHLRLPAPVTSSAAADVLEAILEGSASGEIVLLWEGDEWD